jgi:hypothetical protein
MQALKWPSVEYNRSWTKVKEASNSPDAPKELAPLKGKTDEQMKAGWRDRQVQGPNGQQTIWLGCNRWRLHPLALCSCTHVRNKRVIKQVHTGCQATYITSAFSRHERAGIYPL